MSNKDDSDKKIRLVWRLLGFGLQILFLLCSLSLSAAVEGVTTPRSSYQKPPLTLAQTCESLLRAAKSVFEEVTNWPTRKDPIVDITPTDKSFEIRERPFQAGEEIKFRPDLIPHNPILVVDPVTGGPLFRIVNVIEGRFGGLRLVIEKATDGPWHDFRKPDFQNLKDDDADLIYDLRSKVFLLGEVAASFFGYRYVDSNTIVLPDAAELQGASEHFNARSPKEIRLLTNHYSTDEAFFDGNEYILSYGVEFGVPFARRGRQSLHDLSAHALQNFLTDPNFSKSLQNKVRVWPLFEKFLRTKPQIPPQLIANITRRIDNNIDQVGMIEGNVIPFTMQKVAYRYTEGLSEERREAYQKKRVMLSLLESNDPNENQIELSRYAHLISGFQPPGALDEFPAQTFDLLGYLSSHYSREGIFSYRREDERKSNALEKDYKRVVREFISLHPELLGSTGPYSDSLQDELDSLRIQVRTARNRADWMKALSAHPFTRIGAARILQVQGLVGTLAWP